jgi:hypothetical protein
MQKKSNIEVDVPDVKLSSLLADLENILQPVGRYDLSYRVVKSQGTNQRIQIEAEIYLR